jgi:hypothetical protein
MISEKDGAIMAGFPASLNGMVMDDDAALSKPPPTELLSALFKLEVLLTGMALSWSALPLGYNRSMVVVVVVVAVTTAASSDHDDVAAPGGGLSAMCGWMMGSSSVSASKEEGRMP